MYYIGPVSGRPVMAMHNPAGSSAVSVDAWRQLNQRTGKATCQLQGLPIPESFVSASSAAGRFPSQDVCLDHVSPELKYMQMLAGSRPSHASGALPVDTSRVSLAAASPFSIRPPTSVAAAMQALSQQQQQQQQAAEVADRRKTILCRLEFLEGGCPRGPACNFAHSEEEQRLTEPWDLVKTRPCRKHLETGFCVYGKNCRYEHNGPMRKMGRPPVRGSSVWSSSVPETTTNSPVSSPCGERSRSPCDVPISPPYQSHPLSLPFTSSPSVLLDNDLTASARRYTVSLPIRDDPYVLSSNGSSTRAEGSVMQSPVPPQAVRQLWMEQPQPQPQPQAQQLDLNGVEDFVRSVMSQPARGSGATTVIPIFNRSAHYTISDRLMRVLGALPVGGVFVYTNASYRFRDNFENLVDDFIEQSADLFEPGSSENQMANLPLHIRELSSRLGNVLFIVFLPVAHLDGHRRFVEDLAVAASASFAGRNTVVAVRSGASRSKAPLAVPATVHLVDEKSLFAGLSELQTLLSASAVPASPAVHSPAYAMPSQNFVSPKPWENADVAECRVDESFYNSLLCNGESVSGPSSSWAPPLSLGASLARLQISEEQSQHRHLSSLRSVIGADRLVAMSRAAHHQHALAVSQAQKQPFSPYDKLPVRCA